MSSLSRHSDDTSVSIDQFHDLIASSERRYLLYALSEFESPISLPRAAEYVTERLYEVSPEKVSEERLEIYLRLYHKHVPRLAEAGVVVYHQDEDTIEPGPAAATLECPLQRVMDDEFGDREDPSSSSP